MVLVTWVRIRGTIVWNIEPLAGVDMIGIPQSVRLGDTVGIRVKSAANAEQGIPITNHIMVATAAASIAPPRLALRSISQLQQDNG
jgi:hypothetical protein